MKLLYVLVITCSLIVSALALPASSVVFYQDGLGQYSYRFETPSLSKSEVMKKDGESEFAYGYIYNDKNVLRVYPVVVPLVNVVVPHEPENKNTTVKPEITVNITSGANSTQDLQMPFTEVSSGGISTNSGSGISGVDIMPNDTNTITTTPKPETDKPPQIVNVINFHPLKAYSTPSYIKYASRFFER